MNEFRVLKADEIDVRVQQVLNNGDKYNAILLLYKDARCDMNILDETVGITNWQRSHDVVKGNLYCTVSIYDEDKNIWVYKQDVGTESNTESEKGEASDSFKRACFNWGIGRELYTSPFIYIDLNKNEVDTSKGKPKLKSSVNFTVKEITYENRRIKDLVIVDRYNKVRFSSKGDKLQKPLKDDFTEEVKYATDEQREQIQELLGVDRVSKMLEYYKIKSTKELPYDEAVTIIQRETKK
jgi:hypothetical protein